jgi:isochorismate hydrolase
MDLINRDEKVIAGIEKIRFSPVAPIGGDGCDKGFLITLIDDACATHAEARHNNSLSAIKGYCRIRNTEDLLKEINN